MNSFAGGLNFFRAGFTGRAFAPFAEDAVAAVVDLLKAKNRPLSPRDSSDPGVCYDECVDAAAVEITAADCKAALAEWKWEDE